MRFESMEQEIRTIVAVKAGRDPAALGLYEDFEEDLGFDSLDRLDLLAEVEDEFDIRLCEDLVAEVRNLDALLKAAGVRPRERAA